MYLGGTIGKRPRLGSDEVVLGALMLVEVIRIGTNSYRQLAVKESFPNCGGGRAPRYIPGPLSLRN